MAGRTEIAGSTMTELTFFGRGGQGAVIASDILGEAYFRDGYFVQSFPSFGVERRGAPVTAFLRIDKEFIYLRSMIYQADCGLVLAADILQAPTFRPTVKDGATVVVNASSPPALLSGLQMAYIDATAIALKHKLGSPAAPLVNTAMLGAFARVNGSPGLESLLAAVEQKVPQNAKQNLEAVRDAYDSVKNLE